MEDIEEQVEDEERDEDAEEAEVVGEPVVAARDADGDEVESIEDLLVKKEARAEEEEDDEDSVLSLSREERLEPSRR